MLDVDPADYSRDHVCQPITGFRTGIIGRDEIGTDYGRVVSYGIRRCEFDHFLLERRRGNPPRRGGSRSAPRRKPLDRQRSDSCLGSRRSRRTLLSVARALGGREGDQVVTVAAQEIEFAVQPDDERQVRLQGEIPELYFCPDLAGYGWCFRKGNYLNIGLGRLNSPGVAGHVQAFCQFLRDRGKVCCELPDRFHGHAYRIYERITPKLVGDGVLFIGDAAGLANPQSGEGIRPAVESGMLAADALAAAAGDYRRENLEPYARAIAERFGTPQSGAISDRLPVAFLQFAAARLWPIVCSRGTSSSIAGSYTRGLQPWRQEPCRTPAASHRVGSRTACHE